jgi:putative oxidoreductase
MNQTLSDIGLLLLRLVAGGVMLVSHGWGKLQHYFDPAFDMSQFPDPIGLGGAFSHHLATGAEVICAALLVLGVLTRLSAIPLAITMAVAFFVVHADDPFQVKELAFVYLVMYLVLACTGGGRFALVKSKAFVLS